jgi:hypothetical protein
MSTTRSPHLATPTPATVSGTSSPAAATRRDRRPLVAVAAVTGVSLVGSLLSVANGLSATWWDAVGPTARLSVPLPMNVALLVLGLLAAGTRRRVALVASTLLALACTLAVVSGVFDGGYAAQLAPVERVTQAALVPGLVTVAVVAGRRALAVRGRSGDAG